MRETLANVATEEAFEKMFRGQERLSDGLEESPQCLNLQALRTFVMY